MIVGYSIDMSADDKDTTCPTTSEETSDIVKNINNKNSEEKCEKTTKPPRKVSFPKEEQLVTKYFEPFNPWEDVPSTSKAQLAAEYLEACRGHATPPIDSVLQQIRELPENAIGGGARAPRLTLLECVLRGCAPVDALEALLRKVQFRRLELDHVEIDDEGAEALFDMIEYYESATVVCVMGPREYGIRGWQATSRMIKKTDGGLEASHATVLARSLRPATCPLRSLCLQRTQLSGEPLLCLVMALKSNNSVRELRLGDNRLSAQDAAQLASLLRLNTRLQLLDLSNNLIQDAGVAQIADALVKQSSYTPPSAATSPLSPHHCPISGYESRGLAFLVLWNNQLTRNCAVHLARMLRSSSSLCVLNVGRNALGCDAVRVLAEGGLGALLSLGLQAARLGPDAARPLAALLAAGQLQRLDLRDNKLCSSSLQVILNAMKDNTTITQIDLDDPPSGGVEEERRASGRLRSPAPSPAPSPAGSPVPNAVSRFSVTRVTPDRDSSDSSTPSTPTRPTYCPAPSRFKVVQVVEPPQIQIHPASQSRGVSRFSVTRNYDSSYNPTPSPSSTASPSPEPSTATPSPEPHALMKINSEPAIYKTDINRKLPAKFSMEPLVVGKLTNIINKTDIQWGVDRNVDINQTNNQQIPDCDGFNRIESDDFQIEIKKDEGRIATIEPSMTVDLKHDTSNNEAEFMTDDISSINILDPNESVINRDVSNDKKLDVTSHSEINKVLGNDLVKKTDFETIKNSIETSDKIIEDVKVNSDDDINKEKKDIENLNKDITSNVKVKYDSKQTDVQTNVRDVILKKNKSESSLDSPDLEVSRLMNKRVSAFCDSSSSLEVSGSSMESLNAMDQTLIERDVKNNIENSLESNITTPVNIGYFNTSLSSNESISPIIFGGKKIHGSLSSLEASISSIDSRHDRVMITSTDSGIEYSIQNPSGIKDDESNEGTLTQNSSLKESVRKPEIFHVHETLTSPKRTSSLLDVPALKSKGLDRMRKISWVAPSSSFHIPRPEPEKIEIKLPSHLEKLLSLFQHPSSIFSRSSSHSDDDKKSASNTPPRKDSSLTSSFWSWGSSTEKNDNDSLSEATDSTLSERIQLTFVDESFSKKLDSKTPSTDTDNTLSEFQSFPNQCENTLVLVNDTTDECLVQKNLDLSIKNANSKGNKHDFCDNDINPNDLNENSYDAESNEDKDIKIDKIQIETKEILNVKLDDVKPDVIRPRSFAAVLKQSGTENTMEKPSPDSGTSVDKLPSKIVRGIKENISPENTLTSSMTNIKALAIELNEKEKKTIWETNNELDEIKTELAPIATVEDCDEVTDVHLAYIDDDRLDDDTDMKKLSENDTKMTNMEIVDVGKDALSYLIYENQEYEHTDIKEDVKQSSLAQELIDADIKEKLIDLSPELVIDEAVEAPVFMQTALKSSPVIPERAKIKRSNSLENLSQRLAEIDKDVTKAKTIAFKVPETKPRDIPDRRLKFRTRTGSSPKSLPESLNKPCPLSKMDSGVVKKKKKTSCLGRMARDSLLALNMSEEETAEFRSYKLTSVESLKSLESVSEDANSQSGTSVDSRCKSCLRTSQESLMSLDSINEDCRCFENEKKGQTNR
ncbi:Leucine-rich repeat-containing protein 68 [Papilio xuthus]|uniref:Leucine-rich repeat-containing protein 68 n=1 Tax=Papilio xuthus TaxID=66420 RepID=A0A194Q508_PAPXU|nr:Leucine-rich repeat-containing protein 68 [Papilio xuthus]